MTTTIISITPISNGYHPAVGRTNTVVTTNGTVQLDDETILDMVGPEVRNELFQRGDSSASMQSLVGKEINTDEYNVEFVK